MATDTDFHGAKVALFIGDRLVCILRDDRSDIPWPAHWDLPGGGREGDETPFACVARETREEIGLNLQLTDVLWKRAYKRGDLRFWYFVARLELDAGQNLRLGDEGQEIRLFAQEEFLQLDRAVPQFQQRLADYLAGVSG